MKRIVRRLRGAFWNAMAWGAFWFTAGFAILSVISLFKYGFNFRIVFFNAIGTAIVGALAGGAFSAYVAAVFRNERLAELKPGRLALGGGLVTALLGLLYMVQSRAGSVFWPPRLEEIVGPTLFLGAIGSLTAFGSIKLAQRTLPNSATAPRALEQDSGHFVSESSEQAV